MCVCVCVCVCVCFCPTHTLVQEGEVLLDDGEEGDDGRLHALAAQDVAVLGHVPGRVEDVLQVSEELLVLAGQLLPGAPQAGQRRQIQPTADTHRDAAAAAAGEWVSACVRACSCVALQLKAWLQTRLSMQP